MEKEIKTNVFEIYQVIAKCSDGDVVIGKDGKQLFTYNEAKIIQQQHQGLGAEVVVKRIDMYQVIVKCSNGDVVIGKDGEYLFTFDEAKAIQAQHQDLGVEVVLKYIGLEDVVFVEQVDNNENKDVLKYCVDGWWDFEYNTKDKSLTDNKDVFISDVPLDKINETLSMVQQLYSNYGFMRGSYNDLKNHYHSEVL